MTPDLFPPDRAWEPEIAWDSLAGQALQALLSVLPTQQAISIIVFGSSPLQLAMDSTFLSGVVDVISQCDLQEYIEKAGLTRDKRGIYVQQSPAFVFSVDNTWRERAFSLPCSNVTLIFPHPIDILVSKLPRLEPKDMAAFRLVIEKTGHPTPDEMKIALQRNVDMFRPHFDEENSGDPTVNAQTLWRELWGQTINVRAEIIAPALKLRRAGYELDAPDWKGKLAELGSNES